MSKPAKATEPTDPFLRAHFVAPSVFDLGGRFRPAAIRDQMLRARLLIDRAAEQHLFRTNRILVVGAGVAGVSAAFQAARYGVFSVIAEQNPRTAFGRFVLCSSRWVHPAYYDWPFDHWERDHLDGFPLQFKPGWPSQLAAKWRADLATLEVEGKAQVRYGVHITEDCIRHGSGPVEARLGKKNEFEPYDLVIHCEGPGIEDCGAGGYRGFEFFQTDPFGEPALGLPEGVTPRVLISGGGDGALQDFIRISSGESTAGSLLRKLFPESGTPLERRIATAESQARRSLLWSAHPERPEHDHAVHVMLQEFYKELLGEMKKDTNQWNGLQDRFRQIAGARLRDRRIVHLAHPCSHFSHSYPLNRFAAKLMMRLLIQIDSQRFHTLPNSKTSEVECVGHRCKSASECHGLDHRVRFAPSQCVDGDASAGQEETYNVVVIRHGVRSVSGHGPQVRQMLPFHLAP
jgi:hypothetical protein